ncbi:hypothetical protein ACWD4N_47910, partial [Streptomyces sp. NPDC002586]
LLRRLLENAGVPVQTGFSGDPRRATGVMAGALESDDGGRRTYVFIDYRNNIEHAVCVHGGWRARLVVEDVVTPVYESPGYPAAVLADYKDDTLMCVEAVVAALDMNAE